MFFVLLCAALVKVNAHSYQEPFQSVVDVSTEPWTSKFGPQIDLGYTGPLSFSHLPYTRCLDDGAARFDIGILG